jgi:hypothetical protein
MLLTILNVMIMLSPPTLPRDPNLPPEPTPTKAKASEGTRFTNLENAVITLSMEGTFKRVSWRPVESSGGTRIRITMGDVTIEAARVTMRRTHDNKYEITDMWVNKEGRMVMESRIEPKPKPR